MSRYRLGHGIVVRRTALPSGDIVVTVFGPAGKWRGIARKGKKLGGHTSRLSLFNDVEVQLYARRPDEDLPLITQVVLTGALPRLADPAVYPYAHMLAELVDRITSDKAPDEELFELFASGLRGVHQHHDPGHVALLYGWRLLRASGFAPLVERNMTGPAQLNIPGGALGTNETGVRLRATEAQELAGFIIGSMHSALAKPPSDLAAHWQWFHTYVQYHVHTLNSLKYIVNGGA